MEMTAATLEITQFRPMGCSAWLLFSKGKMSLMADF